MLEKISHIMREPIKIDISQAAKPICVPEPAQDNIGNMMIVIANILRECSENEGFAFASKLLQLVSEKQEQLHKKV